MRRHSLRGYDEEESNDEVYNSKYDSSTEIDLDLEERDNVENKCFICRDTQTFSMNVILKETTVRSDSWDAHLAVPNYPRYVRLETNLGIRQAKEGSNIAEIGL
ncbi:uncharacterized protein TNCV_1850241 [Trichonephila clavipes]|nr:uncharacterized protein TNCV_1850241 [Trichonephila clavipes]